MTTINPYIKQLQETLDIARQELVAQIGLAQSARTTALESREVALHDLVEGRIDLGRAEDWREVAAAINTQAQAAKLMAANVAKSSADSSTAAAAAAAAMATAAASVKAAVAALEALTEDSSGIYKLIHSNDRGDKIDKGGQAANDALDAALKSMNRLKSASLDGNVIAAQSQAATAAQTLALAQTQLDQVADEAVAALKDAQELAKKAVTARNKTAAFYSTQIDPFDEASENLKAFQAALRKVDEKTEGLIKVTIECGNSESPVQLVATYHPWDSDNAPTKSNFIAVKAQAAGGFKYDSKKPGVPGTKELEPEPEKSPAQKKQQQQNHEQQQALQKEIDQQSKLQAELEADLLNEEQECQKVAEQKKQLEVQKQAVSKLEKELELLKKSEPENHERQQALQKEIEQQLKAQEEQGAALQKEEEKQGQFEKRGVIEKRLKIQKQAVRELQTRLEVLQKAEQEKQRWHLQSAPINQDSDGDAIEYGQSYCVFVTWKRDVIDLDADGETIRVLTVPSAPVVVRLSDLKPTRTLPPAPLVLSIEAPAVATGKPALPPAFQAGAFVVGIAEPASSTDDKSTPPTPPPWTLPPGYSIAERRLFIVPKRLYLNSPIDELMLTSQTTANFLSCQTAEPLTGEELQPPPVVEPNAAPASSSTTTETQTPSIPKILAERNRKSAGLAGITTVADAAQLESQLKPFLGYTLVYFSPFDDTPPGFVAQDGFYYGSYSDAFGDPIDLTIESYMLAVVYQLAPLDRQEPADLMLEPDPALATAEMILSLTTELPQVEPPPPQPSDPNPKSTTTAQS